MSNTTGFAHANDPSLVKSLMARTKFGEYWVRSGKITQADLNAALEVHHRTSGRLGEILVKMGKISERDIVEARAAQLDVPYCDITRTAVDSQALALVPPNIARTYTLLPVAVVAGRLRVAMINPVDVEPLDLLHRTTRLRVEPMLAEEKALKEAIVTHYGGLITAEEGESLDSVIDDISVQRDAEGDDVQELIQASEQAPVIKMVNMLITDAVHSRASDIHLEPRKNAMEVRYRVDGVLKVARVLPKAIQAACVSRIKIMADIDISEKRLPQDGRLPVVVSGRSLDLRISTLPTHYGERVVMRVLDKSAGIRKLSEIDFSTVNLEIFERLIRRSFGLILVTGPTGSGKTTTLYSAINALRDEATNIMTCEDPIEYDLDGINQSAVHDKIGLTFARQLRAILRQDPDIVLVGEIRDAETAEIAFRAALTGHLVLSTLHANDAPSAVTRLLDMGVPSFLISSALIGVVAQRLTRRICTDCRKQVLASHREITLLGLSHGEMVSKGAGCPQCDDKGYRGRIGVHEVLLADEEFARLVMEHSPASKLRTAALAAGMVSIRDDALGKVRTGLTSADEVIRKLTFREDADFMDSIDSEEGYLEPLKQAA